MNNAEWVKTKDSSPVGTKTFKGPFLKSEFTSLSTFKAEVLSYCSSNAVYDIQFCSSGRSHIMSVWASGGLQIICNYVAAPDQSTQERNGPVAEWS